ncbi:NAD(P)H-binding protein [Nonomuraea sp. NPDC050556]|uniref:NAD(P)H-binding protein n=1 Tax=Nonomuraea sp. NPDC050556 TaxID=3364369 RepID=UPI0037B55638
MILVTGATGNVGRHTVAQLAELGVPARALVRNPAAQLPVPTVVGDLTDPSTLPAALDGVSTVFLIWPGFAASTAAEVISVIERHASRIVYLSANVTPETKIFHNDVERLIRASGLSWTFLRPGGFASNTLGWAEQIREGVVRWPYGKAARSLIHEADIASVATHVLTTEGHEGQSYVLSGPEVLSQADQVRIIGEAVGRTVTWDDLPPAVAREELVAAWGDEGFVDGALAAWAAMVDVPEPVVDTVERLTGKPARTFHQWAEDHAEDFR